MTRYFGRTAVAFALVVGTGAASAQTVITREITTEPVETIIERGPTGTVITRRPLETSVPGSPARLQADTFISEPVETIVERRRETTGVSATSAAPAAAPALVRSTRVQRSVARPVPGQARARTAASTTTVQRAAAPVRQTQMRAAQTRAVAVRAAPVARPLADVRALTAAQRSRIYQTVVRERVVPRTVITERTVLPGTIPLIGAPVAREQIVTERLVTVPPARETFGAAPFVTAPAGVERVVTEAEAELMVGSRIPATVPIYALPETLVRQIPTVQPYRYAIVDDRVLLVDPVTNVIVAELDQ
jgi:hypothetical protein